MSSRRPEAPRLGEVASLVELVTGRPAAGVRPEHRFVDDLGVDSLAMLRLLSACRESLGVEVPVEATRQLVHVGDLLDFLHHHPPPAGRRAHGSWSS